MKKWCYCRSVPDNADGSSSGGVVRRFPYVVGGTKRIIWDPL